MFCAVGLEGSRVGFLQNDLGFQNLENLRVMFFLEDQLFKNKTYVDTVGYYYHDQT